MGFLGVGRLFPPGSSKEDEWRRMFASKGMQAPVQPPMQSEPPANLPMAMTPNQQLGPGAFDPLGIGGGQRPSFGGNMGGQMIEARPNSSSFGPPMGQAMQGGEGLDKPEAPRRRGGIGGALERFMGQVGEAARNGDLQLILGAMGSDPATAARYRMALMERRDGRRTPPCGPPSPCL